MNNLAQRICSAVVLVLLLVFLIHSSITIPVKASVVSILSLIILWEYSRLFKSRFFQIFFLIVVIGELLSAPFFTEYIEKTGSYMFWFLCLLWILILFQVLTYKKKNINSEVVTQLLYGDTFKVLKKSGSLIKIKNDTDYYKGMSNVKDPHHFPS